MGITFFRIDSPPQQRATTLACRGVAGLGHVDLVVHASAHGVIAVESTNNQAGYCAK